VFAVIALVHRWSDVRAALAGANPRWWVVALSCVPVLASYALLIEAWRLLLGGWGAGLPFWGAARIWTVSNLGRYVPGKVWQIGTMAVMAQSVGVPTLAAAGAALMSTVITLASGFAVAALCGARLFADPVWTWGALAVVLAGLTMFPLALPRAAQWLARYTRREQALPPLPAVRLWIVFFTSAVAWILFGAGFHALSIGITGARVTTLWSSIAAFTGSYLLGFLAIIVPGGLVVREAGMQSMLTAAGATAGTALVLAVASRLWLTVLEIVPALLFLAAGAAWPGARTGVLAGQGRGAAGGVASSPDDR